jgi:hypothetical protein
MTADPRESRLPQWARHTLEKLRTDLEDSKAKLDRVTSSGSGVIIRDPYEARTPVAEVGDWLRLDLPDREYLEMRWNGDWLEVRSNTSLEFQPQVSNVMRVRSATHWRKP